MSAPAASGRRPTMIVVGAAAAAGLATISMLAVASDLRSERRHGTVCTVPALPGRVVDVTLIDMSPGMMQGGQNQWRTWHHGMMRVAVNPMTVAHGQVSLRVSNAGVLKHELVVLPLAASAAVGQRIVGNDGQVDETGAVGEASHNCGAGSGEGIKSGSSGWVTLSLPAGRYELLCNLPGHYNAGMFTELTVT